MVVRTVKLRPILPQANSLCYEVDATSVNLFLDFTIKMDFAMKTADKLTLELQKAEQEIDNYYKSNPLLKLPFATAAWALLAFAEESM